MSLMKRDRYISIIKDLLNDQNSFLYKYKDEIFEKTMELFSYVTLMMDQDTLRLVNRIAKMRFEECKSDEKIIEELTDVNKCDVYKTIKYIEEITSDILLSVVTDYLISEEEQPDIFEVLLVNTDDCDEQEELVEDLVQIVTVFSCKLQGKRANKAKKLIRELIQEEVDGKSHKSNVDTKQCTEN